MILVIFYCFEPFGDPMSDPQGPPNLICVYCHLFTIPSHKIYIPTNLEEGNATKNMIFW